MESTVKCTSYRTDLGSCPVLGIAWSMPNTIERSVNSLNRQSGELPDFLVRTAHSIPWPRMTPWPHAGVYSQATPRPRIIGSRRPD